jgi:hypothetical protein
MLLGRMKRSFKVSAGQLTGTCCSGPATVDHQFEREDRVPAFPIGMILTTSSLLSIAEGSVITPLVQSR